MKRSKSEVKRLLKQGAIEVNGAKVFDPNYKVKQDDVVRIGKKEFFKIDLVLKK